MQLLFNKQALNAQEDERAYTLLRSIFPNTPDHQTLHNIVDAYVTLQHIVVGGAKYFYSDACGEARSCLEHYFQHPTAESFSACRNPNSQSVEDYLFEAIQHSGILPYLDGSLETGPRGRVGLQDHQPAPWSLRVAAWLVAGFVRGEASGKLRTVEGEGVENWKILVL